MTREATFDALVFLPHDGGAGSSIACTTASGTTAVAVEGHGYEQDRICVTNHGTVCAFIRYGFNAGVRSTTRSQAVLQGTQVLFRLDNPREATLWVSACTAEGTTTLQVTRGKGL